MTSPSERLGTGHDAILPVIDLMGGEVVRGVGGRRESYRAVDSVLAADAKPASVARALVESFGFADCYVADIDAIQGDDICRGAISAITDHGLGIWLDCGIQDAPGLRQARMALAGIPVLHWVIGLESLSSWRELRRLHEELGPQLVLSLDMREGECLTSARDLPGQSPTDVVAGAAEMGVAQLILLDLADVGNSGGVSTSELLATARQFGLSLVTGGGVRDIQDILRQVDLGACRVLVASALHNGKICPPRQASD